MPQEVPMSSIRRLVADRPAALIGDAAGLGAIVVLLMAALHLPTIL